MNYCTLLTLLLEHHHLAKVWLRVGTVLEFADVINLSAVFLFYRTVFPESRQAFAAATETPESEVDMAL